MSDQIPAGELWVLRYRKGQIVTEGMVRATSQARADAVGREYCRLGGVELRYISVHPAVLADESILPVKDEPSAAETAEAQAAPTSASPAKRGPGRPRKSAAA